MLNNAAIGPAGFPVPIAAQAKNPPQQFNRLPIEPITHKFQSNTEVEEMWKPYFIIHPTYRTVENTTQKALVKSLGSEPHLVIEYLPECYIIAQQIGIANEHTIGTHIGKVGLKCPSTVSSVIK